MYKYLIQKFFLYFIITVLDRKSDVHTTEIILIYYRMTRDLDGKSIWARRELTMIKNRENYGSKS